MRTSPQIVLASTNYGKFCEMRALLARYPEVELIAPQSVLRNADKIGVVEIYSTYAENAAAKARLVNQGCHFPALADDSGLEVFSLDGKPGVQTAHFGGYAKLIAAMQGQTNREARFVCHLALVIEGTLITATGTLEGTIANEARGEMGFGYDPVFIPKGETRTLAQMTETEKNAISHRARALELLMKEVASHGIQFAKP